MIITIIILSIFLCISVYANINSLRNIEKLENELDLYIEEFKRLRITVTEMRTELKAIDHRGSFEADDEVGIFFKNLKTILTRLDYFFKNTEDENNA
jgi:hypothetical protein